eukprot:8046884-Pyramimonas_sp.AAC.1
MAPRRTAAAGWRAVNEAIGSRVHRRKAEMSYHMCRTCANVARIQNDGGRRNVKELPCRNRICIMPEWLSLPKKNMAR